MVAHAPRLRGGRLWRIGSSASKRVARCAAWMPTHSAEQWSMAMNTAAWPSPVIVVVRSVPTVQSQGHALAGPRLIEDMAVRNFLRSPFRRDGKPAGGHPLCDPAPLALSVTRLLL